MDSMDQQGTPAMKPPQKGGVGPVLGIIIIIVLIALGGLYYFTKGIPATDQGTSMTPAEEAASITAQGTTSNLNDIQADADATDFSSLDQSAASVDSSLQTQ